MTSNVDNAGSGAAETPEKVSYRLMSMLQNARNALAMRIGSMFNGARDLYATFGYPATVDYGEVLAKYARQDIVSRIVNAYPDAVWTRPPQIVGNNSLATAVSELDAALGLFHYINRADRLAGIGKYSIILLGFNDVRNNEDMSKPVSTGAKLSYMQAYGYGSLRIAAFEDNVSSPAYGMPKLYDINPISVSPVAAAENIPPLPVLQVHRSRVVHIADCQLDSDIEGYPIIERVYNRLLDVEKVVGGSAEMFWHNGRKGMQIDVDKDTEFSKEDATKLRTELDNFANDIQRYIRTRGVTIKDLGSQVVNPEPVFNVIMSIISVATGIPQRIFIGSEQGKLASEQDRANWAIRIDERRILYAEPRILKPLLTRLQMVGVLPKGSYTLEWPEAFRMSPLERAQTAAQQARSATNLARARNDFQKPIEGVDYPIRRPTKQFSGGGGFGSKAFVATLLASAAPNGTAGGADKSKQQKPAPASGDKKAPQPDAPKVPEPIEVPMEEITVNKPTVLSDDEIRQIIFARGELKSEGNIDGVMN